MIFPKPSWMARRHKAHSTDKPDGYLFLAQEGKVQHDLQRVGIGSNDDEFGDSSIKCLGCFIGSLFDLLETGTLPHQIINHRG